MKLFSSELKHFQELDGFDSSIFWTAGFLWKFFSTCGVEAWDRDFGELVGGNERKPT